MLLKYLLFYWNKFITYISYLHHHWPLVYMGTHKCLHNFPMKVLCSSLPLLINLLYIKHNIQYCHLFENINSCLKIFNSKASYSLLDTIKQSVQFGPLIRPKFMGSILMPIIQTTIINAFLL